MEHPDLVDMLLNVHGAILVAAVAAFYAYSDRTDGFAASLASTTSVLTEIRRRIAASLGNHLTTLFENQSMVPSPTVTENGGVYIERPANPVGSETYRECVRSYVDDRIEWVVDYHALMIARDRWCAWTTAFRNSLFGLFIWQLIWTGALLLDKAGVVWYWNETFVGTCSLTVAGVLVVICCIGMRLTHYRTITTLRLKYAEL